MKILFGLVAIIGMVCCVLITMQLISMFVKKRSPQDIVKFCNLSLAVILFTVVNLIGYLYWMG